MVKDVDFVGKIFGRLTVISMDYNYAKWRVYCDCLCECGYTKKVRTDHLKTGRTSSCGCYLAESASIRSQTHGQTVGDKRSSEYTAWRAMKQRCHSASYHAKDRYSERGISICERWENSFEAFLEDMGKKPTNKHTLDRLENDKGYYKGNCAWRTVPQQQKNKSNNRWIEYNGMNMILSEWARYFNVNCSTLGEHLLSKPFNQIYNYYKTKLNGRFNV